MDGNGRIRVVWDVGPHVEGFIAKRKTRRRVKFTDYQIKNTGRTGSYYRTAYSLWEAAFLPLTIKLNTFCLICLYPEIFMYKVFSCSTLMAFECYVNNVWGETVKAIVANLLVLPQGLPLPPCELEAIENELTRRYRITHFHGKTLFPTNILWKLIKMKIWCCDWRRADIY